MLARHALPVMFEELFDAYADMEVANVRHLASSFIGGITFMSVTGKPRRRRCR